MNKVYIATGNPAKFKNFKKFLSWIDSDISVEMIPKKIEVEENGDSIAENSRLKVLPYKNKYKIPILSNDFGLKFDKKVVELQESSKVKRAALEGKNIKELSQEEVGKNMFDFYRRVARKYGGKVKCEGIDVFTILYPDGNIKQTRSVRQYELVDREVDEYNIYHPLNSLRISLKLNKFMDDFTDEDFRDDMEPLMVALKDLLN